MQQSRDKAYVSTGAAGRAGNKGTSYTFICEEEEKYAPDLVKALQESGAAVPRDLMEIADNFTAKRKRGEVQAHGSGYGGSGFKFDAEEEELRNAERKVRACRCCSAVPVLLQLLSACRLVLM